MPSLERRGIGREASHAGVVSPRFGNFWSQDSRYYSQIKNARCTLAACIANYNPFALPSELL